MLAHLGQSMESRLEIDGWRTNLRFSSCHMLLKHSKCSRIHGHSYAIHLRMIGEIDENSLLVDFGHIKGKLRELARELDHKVMIPTMSRAIQIKDDPDSSNIEVNMSGKIYSFPRMDVAFIPAKASTVEETSAYLLKRLVDEVELPVGIREISLGVDEGPGQGAWSSWKKEDRE